MFNSIINNVPVFFIIFICFSCVSNEDYEYDASVTVLPNEIYLEDFQDYSFDIDTVTYNLKLNINRKIANEYENSVKFYSYNGSNPPMNWEIDYYTMFLDTEQDEQIIEELSEILSSDLIEEKDFVAKAVLFVQGAVEYDFDKLNNLKESEVNYPYESLYLKRGICSEKSLLLAKLLIQNNFNICFFLFPKANHMALGIKVSHSEGSYGTNYCFIESTDYSPIGEIPDTMLGGVVLDNSPGLVIPIYNGKNRYKGLQQVKADYEAQAQLYGPRYNWVSKQVKVLLIKKAHLNNRINQINTEIDELSAEMRVNMCEGELEIEKYEFCADLSKRLEKLYSLAGSKTDSINVIIDRVNVLNEIDN
jgi:hypothetical protein